MRFICPRFFAAIPIRGKRENVIRPLSQSNFFLAIRLPFRGEGLPHVFSVSSGHPELQPEGHDSTPCYNPHHVWPPRQAYLHPADLSCSAVYGFAVCARLFRGLSVQRLCSTGSEVRSQFPQNNGCPSHRYF